MKQRLEEIKNMKSEDLVKEKETLSAKYLLERAKLVASDVKSSKEIRGIKKEICWISTIINEKFYSNLGVKE